MKKILLLTGIFILLAIAFTACEKQCKTCRQVTYINGSYDHEGNSNEYCGASLLAIESMDDVKIGDSVTTWECN
jgi:hypothetical protein